MTEQEVIDAIKITIPADYADKDKVARSYMNMAILELGREPRPMFNKVKATFSLTSGTATYRVGVDLFSEYIGVEGLTRIHFNDTSTLGWVDVIDTEEFSGHARGSNYTGKPKFAAYYSEERLLEFWPRPDRAYAMWVLLQKATQTLSDIPFNYHDLVVKKAVEILVASKKEYYAVQQGQKASRDMNQQTGKQWTGARFQAEEIIQSSDTNYNKADRTDLSGGRP